jgi:hypothetical protein
MLLPGEEAPAPALGHPVGQSAPVAPPEPPGEGCGVLALHRDAGIQSDGRGSRDSHARQSMPRIIVAAVTDHTL